tara:strand:+ start:5578 stop:6702 length:1125 start_codon:yes stop_codon:yes gene_type:complete
MATDAEIRDRGILYMPKQKYLENPYNLPLAPETVAPVPGGITNTNAFNNNGGGETRYDNSFLPELPQSNKSGTYPGGFQSNEGGFEYTNSFPNNSIQMENLNNSYLNKGNTFQSGQFNANIQDEKDLIAEMAAQDANTKNIGFTYPNDNRFSTIGGQNNVFDVNVKGDPALNKGSKMAQGNDPYSEKAFEEEEDKQSFIANMISRAKQVGSNLPAWAKAAATAMGGPFAVAASFLGKTGGKSREQFDPRGNFKGGIYKMDGVNYADPSMVNESYDNDPSSPTYGTNRFDRAKPGSFASYRTLSGYLNRNKDTKTTTAPKTITTNNSGNDNNDNRNDTSNDTNPNPSTPGAQDSFSNKSGKGRTGYFYGGLASIL